MQKKQLVTISVSFIVILGLAAAAWFLWLQPKSVEGQKAVTVVVVADEQTKSYEYKTEAGFLLELLQDKKLVATNTSTYGEYITAVNGRTAVEADQEYWSISVNGEYSEYGVSQIPVQDGDTYELSLEKW